MAMQTGNGLEDILNIAMAPVMPLDLGYGCYIFEYDGGGFGM